MKKAAFSIIIFASTVFVGCHDEEILTAPKLDYYIESSEFSNQGLKPEFKVSYEYNAESQLTKYIVSVFNLDQSLTEQHYYTFSYANGHVDGIKEFLANSSDAYVEYAYEYLANGNVSKIAETNHAAGVNSVANFTYDLPNNLVKVSYTYSNGGAFEYEFNYTNSNIVTDKTTKGDQLCSNGEYTYDQHKNPFKDLGYVDYDLTTLSANNKLSESVNYVGCSFPSLVPESYTYEYNDRGYPTTVTTHYKSSGSLYSSQKKFFYK